MYVRVHVWANVCACVQVCEYQSVCAGTWGRGAQTLQVKPPPGLVLLAMQVWSVHALL